MKTQVGLQYDILPGITSLYSCSSSGQQCLDLHHSPQGFASRSGENKIMVWKGELTNSHAMPLLQSKSPPRHFLDLKKMLQDLSTDLPRLACFGFSVSTCCALLPASRALVIAFPMCFPAGPVEDLISPYCEGIFGHCWPVQEQVRILPIWVCMAVLHSVLAELPSRCWWHHDSWMLMIAQLGTCQRAATLGTLSMDRMQVGKQ